MRKFLAVLLLLAAVPGGTEAGAGKKPQRPNIVYIMADDLGWKDVGYHGSEIRTPALDALAKKGVRLERFHVQPVCSPTRAAFMTGRYPCRYGLQTGVVRPWADYGLPLQETTLAQVLRGLGYFTALIGKWHLGAHDPAYLPTRRGFDHHYGHYLGAIDYFDHTRMGGLDWHRNTRPVREKGYTTQLMGKEAVDLIRKHDAGKQPLFLFMAFNAPHTPLQAPESYLKQYDGIKNKKRRSYAAMVTCLDDAVRDIVAALKEKGMLENTLILFSSDNGGPITLGANNGPLRGSKGSLYTGGVRVTAFAHWPGHLPAGTENTEFLHVVDWFPTLVRLAGGKAASKLPLDGKDIWPCLTGKQRSPHEEILVNVEADRGALIRGDRKIVVRGKLPLVLGKDQALPEGIELFDANEPGEKTNLAGREPLRVRELLERLNRHAREAVPAKGGMGGGKGFKAPAVWGSFP